uniref:Type I restriction enzyme R protein N-terminal domain-containing protein n=1 Tax=Candidatus Kentrum sp. MB TaxID=2138164 RepID=A0A450XVJ0_9GAMM|nr:MAG: hypothetical protein BECKMB1821G_GA0114241_104113 [Candidatus Kentron sp. MB]VFK33295.1 MAG: hypothetical protein BECKMB1821I_GA0114274_104315 [Candidatus Kentron sp. MB]VFK76087.1 MAG: hypothetical protein BECKMB1821H_GA0114242_104115 [Candidatus Kentron sp. MB]
MNRALFVEGEKYTFSDYFDFNHSVEEIACALGYSFETRIIDFPIAGNADKTEMMQLQEGFYEILPKISLNSEIAKRDFMIAPVLWAIIRKIKAKINVEYPIYVDDKLSGSLDYLIRSDERLVVIEAKKGDLDKGFNQLVAELIALDKIERKDIPEFLYGAISIGELWRFGILERAKSAILRDLHTYRVPEDIEQIFLIIVGILQDGACFRRNNVD